MHSIKVSDETYSELRKIQGPRESYGDVVTRLLTVWKAWLDVGEALREDSITRKALLREE